MFGTGRSLEHFDQPGFDQADVLAGLRECPTEELEEAFGQLDALENAVRVQRLHVLAVLDEREAGRDDSALDTEGWVAAASLVTRPHAAQCAPGWTAVV
jgi:hypothetical protein